MKTNLAIVLIFFALVSCSEARQSNDVFIFFGDSHVANWDLNLWFPFSTNLNYGEAGNRISDLLIRGDEIKASDKNVIMIGVNDIIMLSSSRADNETILVTNDLINSLFEYTDSDCIIMAIMPVTVQFEILRNSNINYLINEVNEHIEETCKSKNVVFIDSNTILKKGAGLNESFSLDGIHLNNVGYEVISKILRPYIY